MAARILGESSKDEKAYSAIAALALRQQHRTPYQDEAWELRQKQFAWKSLPNYEQLSDQALLNLIAASPEASLRYAYSLQARWPPGEPAIASRGDLAYSYLRNFFMGQPWPEAEAAIARKPYTAFMYARDILKGPFPAGEKAIYSNAKAAIGYRNLLGLGFPKLGPKDEAVMAKDPSKAYRYALRIAKGPWPPGEPAILRGNTESYRNDILSKYILLKGGRWPEGEAVMAKGQLGYPPSTRTLVGHIERLARKGFKKQAVALLSGPWRSILDTDLELAIDACALVGHIPGVKERATVHPKYAYQYAEKVMQGRFPEGEKAIATSAPIAVAYAKLTRQRFLAAEDEIATSAYSSVEYANFLGTRFLKGEEVIAKNATEASEYLIYYPQAKEEWMALGWIPWL